MDHIDGYLEHAAGAASGNIGTGGQAARVLGGADSAKIHALAVATRDADAWVVPTEYLWENFFSGRTPEEFERLARDALHPAQHVDRLGEHVAPVQPGSCSRRTSPRRRRRGSSRRDG